MKDEITVRERAEHSIITTYRQEIWGKFTKAVKLYELIEDGDRIAVCVSGGKDSMLLAKLFEELWRHGKRNFELGFICMDPGYSERVMREIDDNAELLGIPLTKFETDILRKVAGEKSSPCYVCGRMRRGWLYAKARELGYNKIALGHHFDDVIETSLMSMLYGGQIGTMLPKLRSKNFPGMQLIRPMYLIRESDIIRWVKYNGLSFTSCACGLFDNGRESKRAAAKRLIAELKRENPQVESSIFHSMENVNLNTVLGYNEGGLKHDFLERYASLTGEE